MRILKVMAPGLYVFGLLVGSLTLGSGCGGSSSDEATVPPRGEPTAEEKQGRMEAMKKAMQGKRKGG